MQTPRALPTLAEMFSLAGRTAVVTGGSSGIGGGIARALAGAGAHVVIIARGTERIDAAVAEMRGGGAIAAGVTADLSTREGIAEAITAVQSSAGNPDILVTAAGINIRPPMAELSIDEWDVTMRVNLDAPFLLGQAFAPAMMNAGYGRFIHISSQQAQRPFAHSGAYGVSKAAVEGLARVQSEAWASYGVTANTLVPGFVPTPLNTRLSADPAVVAALAARTTVGRNGTPEDFAAAAVFLASAGSAYVTGQTLAVDGGFSVH